MRIYKNIFTLLGLLFVNLVSAQYIQLIDNRGEIGIMGGGTYYRGDIATDQLFYKPNAGLFYKKQLNDYVGIRLTYEYIALGANDAQSLNPYEVSRGFYFEKKAHDVSLMAELNFLKFINGNKEFRFTPYLGFGIGGMKTISFLSSLSNPPSKQTILFPINLGIKYNVFGPWNIFGEATYRFTNSDKIDFFDDHTTTSGIIQASRSGNDSYFSAKLGISYNLLKIYGPDKPKAPKKPFFKSRGASKEKTIKNGLFSFLKRN
jgi:opacity protein-like surface antigen